MKDKTLDFEIFFKENQKTVFRIMMGYVHSRDIAEDLTVESFLKVYDRWGKVSLFDNPVGYLVRVAVNSAKTFLKRKKPLLSLDAYEYQLPSSNNSPEESFFVGEENRWLEKELLILKEDARNIILLKDIDRKKFEEIAVIMDKNISTVKSIYRRAKIKLSEKLYAVESGGIKEAVNG